VRKQYQTWLDAFTDLQVEFLDVIESGDALAGEVRLSMTQTGPLVTPNGTIPPTGKRETLESVDIAHAGDGLIVSFHSYFDQLALMAQLGLMEAPAPGVARGMLGGGVCPCHPSNRPSMSW
jgi:predicted ester cyclase